MGSAYLGLRNAESSSGNTAGMARHLPVRTGRSTERGSASPGAVGGTEGASRATKPAESQHTHSGAELLAASCGRVPAVKFSAAVGTWSAGLSVLRDLGSLVGV